MKKDLSVSDEMHSGITVAPKLVDRYKQLNTTVESQTRCMGAIEKKEQEIKDVSASLKTKKADVKKLKAELIKVEKELKKAENECAKLGNKLELLKEAKAKLKESLKEIVDTQKAVLAEISKVTKIKTVKDALKAYDKCLEEAKSAKKAEKAEEKAEEVEKTVAEKKETVTEKKETVDAKKEAKEVKKTTKKKSKKATKAKEDTKEVVTPPTVKPEVVVEDRVVDIEKAETVAVAKKKKIEIIYSFDTTGSMYTVLSLVRKNIGESIKQMFNLDCDLRVGVLAHGDYCDKDKPYTIMFKDLTDDEDSLQEFVKTIEPTYGGDMDECYELVLNTINELASWSEDSIKMVVMIGDANPHSPSYKLNERKLDWKAEAKNLADKNVNVYAVHALSNYRKSSKEFYETVAEITNGIYLTLDTFSDVNDIMIASLYQRYSEEKLDQYVTVIRDNGRLTRTLANNVNRLAKKNIVTNKFESIKGLNVVPAGRFQVIPVDEKCDIKGFVQNNGIMYKVGRAFYELTKTEDVQQYKEVILQDKESGDMYYGEDTRKYLGLLPQVERSGAYAHEKIKPIKGDKYRVFVQSTSVNRKLVPGTNLLYEISESDFR